ncbi:amino acid permease [Gilvibacter sediminis]|uniref:amino acid permease n=1 Tax=Gilvibacter sediminis TaxID=379071 RepID=UPI00235002A5|nr:amino acid permease [Gilvibacter sediminis]MDC7997232.1 amino acid permease [Gilvibacter sediminis]
MATSSQKIGLITTTALVVGNMIGSGIFVLPATLSKYGSISLVGWIFTAAGALILAKIFANLSKIVHNKSGGPYIFARAGFGDFIGFIVAWGYWISVWVVNAGIAVAIIGALSVFFPSLEDNALVSVAIGLAFIWFFTWVNIRGIKLSGKFAVVTTALKLLPLVLVIVCGIFFFDADNFPAFNSSSASDFDAFSAVATLTLFAFLGIETATIPSENIEQPQKTIAKATMLGTAIATLVYVLSTVVLFGLLPVGRLASSPAPFAEAGAIIAGNTGSYFVAAGALIAAIGALNGWTLVVGQLPMAMARDQVLPASFAKKNRQDAPVLGLLLGGALSSGIMLMNFTESLVDQFEFIALLTTLCCLVPYLFVAAAYILITREKGIFSQQKVQVATLSVLGVIYSLWAIYGSGAETVLYGTILLFAGLPLFAWMKYRQKRKG